MIGSWGLCARPPIGQSRRRPSSGDQWRGGQRRCRRFMMVCGDQVSPSSPEAASEVTHPAHYTKLTMFPVDMSTRHPDNQDKSPPPLTKLVHRKPSSPREFFEKLYGPDPNKDDAKSDRSLSPEIDVSKDCGDTFVHINNNSGHVAPPHHHGPGLPVSSSYLPAFPLPPHEVGIINMDNVPFPGGLAAFCKLTNTIVPISSFITEYFQWREGRVKTPGPGGSGPHSARSRPRCWRWSTAAPSTSPGPGGASSPRGSNSQKRRSRSGSRTGGPRTRG